MDVLNVFLKEDLEGEVYMEISHGFDKGKVEFDSIRFWS